MANKVNTTLTNFVGGEVSPYMEGRVDLELFQKSLQWCENFLIQPQGGASYRPGSFVAGLTKNNGEAVMIPFQFSANDAYIIVATDQKFRFYRNNGVILNTAKTITDITNASPAVVTATSHGYSNGDEVYISGVEGMEQINGRFFKVANKTTHTFELQDQWGTNVDSSLYTAYESGGEAASIYELTTAFTTANLANLRYAQTADTMYIVSQAYAPYKLVRTSHTSWAINTYSRTNDPFTGATKYPAVVAFSADGRSVFANTADNPEGFWESRAPNGATSRFDDFTTGSAATDAVICNFAPVEGIIDSIQEIKQLGRQFVLLGASSIRRVYGASADTPPIPTAINAYPTPDGSARVRPVVVGSTMLFVDVNGKKLKGFQYNLAKDNYETTNYNLVADHLGQVSFKKMVRVKGDPDSIWVLRSDGLLLSFTFNDSENIAGWARHTMGGDGEVEDIATIRRDTGDDQLWLIVKRTMGGKTYRSVEVMSARPVFPQRRSFFTGDKAADTEAYENATWEQLKDPSFLNMTLTYDGRARGEAKSATLTPSATTGDGITITSDQPIFRADHIGQQIWKCYDTDGSGGGQAVITNYLSTTQVTCDVLLDFDSTSAIPYGSWEFATDTITNLHFFEDLEVNIQADGSGHPAVTVENGSITLQNPAARIHVGFGYMGMLCTQNIDIGGRSGPANCKPRNIKKVNMRFKDSIGCKVGPDEYRVQEVVYRQAGQIMGRVPPPFTGVKELVQLDMWGSDSKTVVVIQDEPVPLTITSMDVEVFTVDQT